MTRIFDNIDTDLGPHLTKTFATSNSRDSAVGYFNLRGWSMFAPTVEAKPAGPDPIVRVLVGMTLADPDAQVQHALQRDLEGREEAEEDIDREIARARRQQ